MENTLEKLIEYFEQQLKLQRESKIKYTGEEAYFDAVDVSRNALKSLRQQPVSGIADRCEELIEEIIIEKNIQLFKKLRDENTNNINLDNNDISIDTIVDVRK